MVSFHIFSYLIKFDSYFDLEKFHTKDLTIILLFRIFCGQIQMPFKWDGTYEFNLFILIIMGCENTLFEFISSRFRLIFFLSEGRAIHLEKTLLKSLCTIIKWTIPFIIKNIFTSKVSLIWWLVNPTYLPTNPNYNELYSCKNLRWQRPFNYVCYKWGGGFMLRAHQLSPSSSLIG